MWTQNIYNHHLKNNKLNSQFSLNLNVYTSIHICARHLMVNYFGKSYPLSCRAFNATAVGLLTVGFRAAQDPTIIKLAAASLNALQLNE